MYQRILVPVDGSATSDEGLAQAIRMAELTHGRLRLVHCIDNLSFAFALDAYGGVSGASLDDLRKDAATLLTIAKGKAAVAGVEADGVVYDTFNDRVAEMVTREAASWGADLIVIGTHGRRGLQRAMLGSSAEQILRISPVPVLLVRAAMQDGKE
ncbi:universal stress protein [Variovorax humicola]|uniref:Universal stress protein n=1 Tax=Variovorax humicola TaxID=1769758 RepID=A0ABU8WBV6_9BURK